jgi:cysteinyl-tRNA synthetase
MALTLFNSLSRQNELFVPLVDMTVGMYSCGPTVYNYPHIGNYRAYITSDILKRYLAYRGYTVRHIMNITDIDDKTIRDSQKEGKSLKEFTEFYTKGFFADRDTLHILPPERYTKATDYIPHMVHMIETLLEKGYAYKTDDGSVYFDIKKDTEYGKLSHFKISDLKENADGRLAKKDEYEKENASDFALWKAWDENDGEVFWETSLGKGRPGWHIECSAMSIDTLGESFDIHTGGVDNIFPHHENEIAQSECATGKPFSKYFIHNEHLMVDGAKMSKSAGNFYTLRDLRERGIDPIAFRMWLMTAHYRTKTNFTLDTVTGSQTALNRLKETLKGYGTTGGTIIDSYKDMFISYMDNDLDTPKALALIWEIVKDSTITPEDKRATILDFDTVFGLGLADVSEEVIPEEITHLAEEREQARKEKEWQKSDDLRAQIESLGYEVKDTENGPRVSKI